jgi:A/G-specific adenine glycosylase
MLQQTRVAAVIPFYERFLARFPDAASLASGKEEEVLALWSGLGYYSRARNLQQAARDIAARGAFPHNIADILRLPGVGPYTAAAVASIAFQAQAAAVDGNVLRVMSRLSCDPGDIASSNVKARLGELADQLLDRRNPGDWNQALMELGALVCLPKQPGCGRCPWESQCLARQQGRESELPVKLRRQEPVRVDITLLVIRRRGRILLRKRTMPPNAGFWELPELGEPGFKAGREFGGLRHSIMNRRYVIQVAEGITGGAGAQWKWKKISGIPLTTMTRKALELGKVVNFLPILAPRENF